MSFAPARAAEYYERGTEVPLSVQKLRRRSRCASDARRAQHGPARDRPPQADRPESSGDETSYVNGAVVVDRLHGSSGSSAEQIMRCEPASTGKSAECFFFFLFFPFFRLDRIDKSQKKSALPQRVLAVGGGGGSGARANQMTRRRQGAISGFRTWGGSPAETVRFRFPQHPANISVTMRPWVAPEAARRISRTKPTKQKKKK